MTMSDQHKAALATGRREAAAIKKYLEALENRRPGRPVTLESLQSKLDQVNRQIAAEADALEKVHLIQTRMDLEQRISSFTGVDFALLEEQFREHVASYSRRKGITYSAWREIGVPAALLKRAGVPRTRRT